MWGCYKILTENKTLKNLRSHSRNLFIFITVFIALAVFLSYGMGNVAAANPGDTIYVNSSSGNDSWDGQLAVWNGTSGPKLSIGNAIETVNNGGTVNIADGTYSGVQNTNITISENITLNGQSQDGTIINGTNTNWIFSITPGSNLTITDITLTNGYVSNEEGGGAINCSGNLTVNNCNFDYNNATDGGAIFTWQGQMVVTNSDFTDNTLQSPIGEGGAIFTDVYTNSSMDNCTFNNNGENVFQGGAIEDDGVLDITTCNFVNNTARIGGAIGGDHSEITYNSTLNVYNSNFTQNNALYGGVIYTGGSNGILDNCNFFDNHATFAGVIINFGSLSVNNCKFTNNNATNQGGALLNANILNVTYCNFTNNSAENGSTILNIELLNVSNSIFINNTANLGGVIFNFVFDSLDGTAIMNLNSFIGNTAAEGYVIYNIGGPVNATLNWWGSDSGPSSEDIYGNVTTTPWSVVTANASPNGGYYNTNQTVDLSMNVPGTIYYTSDGSDPTTSSTTYLVPINININTVLKYLAVDTAGDQSPVYTQTYVIDTIPPTATANTTSGLYNTPQTVTLTMSKPGTIYYTTDGTSPTNNSPIYTGPISIPPNTTTTLEYLAIDKAGNNSPIYTQTYSIYPIPIANFTTNTTNGTAPLNVQFNDQSTGNITEYYWTFGEGNTSTTQNHIYTYNTPGTYTVTETVTGPGGISSASLIVTVTPVTIVPIPIASLASGVYNSKQIVTLSDADNEPNLKIYYTLNGTIPTTSSTLYTGPLTINGTTTLEFIASDIDGNISNIATKNYVIDITTPTASVNVNGGLYNTNKVITLTMSEPGNIYYTLNGTTPTSKSILYTKPITISSTTTLKYLAIDLAGNKSSTYVQNYLINKIAPIIVKTNPKYDAINVPLTTPLIITFSENILKGINYNDIYIKNVNTGKLVQITKTISKNTLTIKMIKSRLHNNKYIIYIPKDSFKDLAGNLTASYTIKFKTG